MSSNDNLIQDKDAAASAPEAGGPAPQPGTPLPPACEASLPAGFEEFDLDDIGVIESKVFA